MWRRSWLVFSQAVTVALAVLFVLLTLKPGWLPRGAVGGLLPAPTLVQVAPAEAPTATPAGAAFSYALAARLAAPAVVSVSATRVAKRNPHAEDPRYKFFFRDGPGGGAQPAQIGLGSGVIVSPEGYLRVAQSAGSES